MQAKAGTGVKTSDGHQGGNARDACEVLGKGGHQKTTVYRPRGPQATNDLDGDHHSAQPREGGYRAGHILQGVRRRPQQCVFVIVVGVTYTFIYLAVHQGYGRQIIAPRWLASSERAGYEVLLDADYQNR